MKEIVAKTQIIVAVVCILCVGFFYVYNTASDCVILDNDNPHAEVLAQLGTTGDGSGCGNGGGTPPEGEGGGTPISYHYKDRDYKTGKCTLYKKVNAQGQEYYSYEEFEIEAGWIYIRVEGLIETCPIVKKDANCTIFSCTPII